MIVLDTAVQSNPAKSTVSASAATAIMERSVPGPPSSRQDVTVAANVAVGMVKAKIEAMQVASGLRRHSLKADG